MPYKHDRQQAKPSISLHPLPPEDALAGLLQVKPPGKEAASDEQGKKDDAEPEAKEST